MSRKHPLTRQNDFAPRPVPLVHVEGAARLRVADLEAYVDALASLDTEQAEHGSEN